MNTPGIRLKEMREKLGLTQGQFGTKVGLKGSQIKDMEIGVVKVKPLIAKIIYYEFGGNPEFLLRDIGAMFINKQTTSLNMTCEPCEPYNADSVTAKIVILLKDMSEEARLEILRSVEEKKLLRELLEERKKMKDAG